MNIYRYQFTAACPNNSRQIVYQLCIQSKDMIHVEHIVSFAAQYPKVFHEDLADALHEKFGGRQTMVAHHHGVDIETVRGFE